MVDDKRRLRRRIRTQRQKLSKIQQQFSARGLAHHFSHARPFRSARRIAVYLANDGEIDPCIVVEQAWRAGKQCYLPVVTYSKVLRFAYYTKDQRLLPNRYGIAEPVVSPRQLIAAPQLDLVIIPLVAFDRRGVRLGMGAGFYDRTLSFLRSRKYWHAPAAIGAAHSFQEVDHVPSEPWDVPLEAIVTERAFITV